MLNPGGNTNLRRRRQGYRNREGFYWENEEVDDIFQAFFGVNPNGTTENCPFSEFTNFDIFVALNPCLHLLSS